MPTGWDEKYIRNGDNIEEVHIPGGERVRFKLEFVPFSGSFNPEELEKAVRSVVGDDIKVLYRLYEKGPKHIRKFMKSTGIWSDIGDIVSKIFRDEVEIYKRAEKCVGELGRAVHLFSGINIFPWQLFSYVGAVDRSERAREIATSLIRKLGIDVPEHEFIVKEVNPDLAAELIKDYDALIYDVNAPGYYSVLRNAVKLGKTVAGVGGEIKPGIDVSGTGSDLLLALAETKAKGKLCIVYNEPVIAYRKRRELIYRFLHQALIQSFLDFPWHGSYGVVYIYLAELDESL